MQRGYTRQSIAISSDSQAAKHGTEFSCHHQVENGFESAVRINGFEEEEQRAWEEQQDHPHRVPGHIRGQGSYNNYAEHLGSEVLDETL